MRVINALPAAWLNSQTYQKVTAAVVAASIGLRSKESMKIRGACQPAISTARIAAVTSGVRRSCRAGTAKPRKLGSSPNGPPVGLTMFRPMASTTPYHGLSGAVDGACAPAARLSPMAAACIVSGTASASAYQIQPTRQRIRRAPMSRRPARPSRMNATTRAAMSAPGAKKLSHGMAPHARAYARTKNAMTGCRRIGVSRRDMGASTGWTAGRGGRGGDTPSGSSSWMTRLFMP
jgi:hypothetical protein